MSERTFHPVARLGFAVAIILLSLASIEMAMRYLDRPRGIVSGWRATTPDGPVNPFGYRGQAAPSLRSGDFVIVLTGGAAVECAECPRDETLDLMLERAARQYNPNVRVVTLGSGGYSQDQEYLALRAFLAVRHADLILDWTSVGDDVPGNTFRFASPRPGETRPKPTFALLRDDSVGPTEAPGRQIYATKITTLLRPLFIDLDRNWTTLLPQADPGSATPPPGAETQAHVNENLEQQRTAWSIWLSPRPARVSYGIALTRALLHHMRELAMLRGARFALVLGPEPLPSAPLTATPLAAAPLAAAPLAAAPLTSAPSGPRNQAPIALEHEGHWFLADPAARDAAIAEVTAGMDTLTLPADDGSTAAPEAQRHLMARLAEALNQRQFLAPGVKDGVRH